MKYYFGFDGGATRCRLAISDDKGNILFKDEGGSSNIYAVGREAVTSTIEMLIDKAIKYLNISKDDLIAGCFGSAGLSREKDISFFKNFFSSFLPNSKVYLCSDAEILLVGGLNSLSGLCLIGGTGSVCFGRSESGEIIRSGGFGWRLGDEGSGWYIANTAISRTLKSKEGRDLPTFLDKYILEFFKLNKLEDIISLVNDESTTKSDVGNFAKYVTLAASENDQLALNILKEAGLSLFDLVLSTVSRMPKNHEKKIVLAGGVITKDKVVKESFYNKMNQYLPNYEIYIDSANSALDGAILIALSLI
ncbi:MAG: BadF/BadG/BcrA/BcrD ATPase family protein [Pleomorphochaeta sp.]